MESSALCGCVVVDGLGLICIHVADITKHTTPCVCLNRISSSAVT